MTRDDDKIDSSSVFHVQVGLRAFNEREMKLTIKQLRALVNEAKPKKPSTGGKLSDEDDEDPVDRIMRKVGGVSSGGLGSAEASRVSKERPSLTRRGLMKTVGVLGAAGAMGVAQKLDKAMKKGEKEEPTIERLPHFEGTHGIKRITQDTLGKISPVALQKGLEELDEDDLNIIWIMTEKPEPIVGSKVNDYGGKTYFYEEWTETNEPELAEQLAEDWDVVAIDLGDGTKVVVLAGTEDDEYGYFWDESNQEWSSYNY